MNFSIPSAKLALAGWGGDPKYESWVFRPEKERQLSEIISDSPVSSVLSRGMGRSYGDASLNQDAGVILHTRLNHFLTLDETQGVVCCESGVTLAEIIDVAIPKGLFLPVTPGTKFISVGGAIAADVHGKNHHRDGTISSQLLSFRILTGEGQVLHCSREENADLFWATLGGLGLTGSILQATLQLRRVESAWMDQTTQRCHDLDSLLQRTFEEDDQFEYSVAWVDCLAQGRSLGRSVLLRANGAPAETLPARVRANPLLMTQGRTPSVPFNLPSFSLNALNMKIFNKLYWHSHRDERKQQPLQNYFYPLDQIHHWNRIYGRQGVSQYQFVLPKATCQEGIQEILEYVVRTRGASFLAVLKKTGPANAGPLSFPIEGASLALDFPNRKSGLAQILDRLDRFVVQYGGRVYLAKDSSLSPWAAQEMYPDLPRFRDVKQRYDPQGRFSSSLLRRLKLMESQ